MTRSRIFVNNVDSRNVLLSLKDLINLIGDNMSCRFCIISNTMEFCAETIGIATKLSIACNNDSCHKCKEWSVMEPTKVDLDKLIDK